MDIDPPFSFGLPSNVSSGAANLSLSVVALSGGGCILELLGSDVLMKGTGTGVTVAPLGSEEAL